MIVKHVINVLNRLSARMWLVHRFDPALRRWWCRYQHHTTLTIPWLSWAGSSVGCGRRSAGELGTLSSSAAPCCKPWFWLAPRLVLFLSLSYVGQYIKRFECISQGTLGSSAQDVSLLLMHHVDRSACFVTVFFRWEGQKALISLSSHLILTPSLVLAGVESARQLGILHPPSSYIKNSHSITRIFHLYKASKIPRDVRRMR